MFCVFYDVCLKHFISPSTDSNSRVVTSFSAHITFFNRYDNGIELQRKKNPFDFEKETLERHIEMHILKTCVVV